MSKPQSDNFSVQAVFRTSDFSGRAILVFSTWFGSGLMPFAPGTLGTVAAIPLVLLLSCLGTWFSALSLVVIAGLGVFTAGRTQDLLERKDPPEVVIDEVAGFLLTMLLLKFSWSALCLGFFLFRFFDIVKPYPLKRVEKLRGGLGIVMDDLLAGLYAGAGGKMLLFFVS